MTTTSLPTPAVPTAPPPTPSSTVTVTIDGRSATGAVAARRRAPSRTSRGLTFLRLMV